MPVYEYVCKDCQKEFEMVQSLSEHETAQISCPGCDSRHVERHYSHVEAITSKKS